MAVFRSSTVSLFPISSENALDSLRIQQKSVTGTGGLVPFILDKWESVDEPGGIVVVADYIVTDRRLRTASEQLGYGDDQGSKADMWWERIRSAIYRGGTGEVKEMLIGIVKQNQPKTD